MAKLNNWHMKKMKKCTHCRHSFELPLMAESGLLNTEWLVHMRTTHGLDPEDVLYALKTYTKVR